MNYLLYVISLVAVYGILTVALNLAVGCTGILSLAQAAFMGIGAYAPAFCSRNGASTSSLPSPWAWPWPVSRARAWPGRRSV